MTLNLAFRLLRPLQRGNILVRRCDSTTTIKEDIDLSEVSTIPDMPDPLDEDKVMQVRNKSRLTTAHRNIIQGIRPYKESKLWVHETVRYKKRILGRYGLNYLDVTPGVVWPTPIEVADAKEYERVAYPRSLEEELDIIKKRKEKRKEEIRNREAELAIKAAKNEKWINDLHNKVKQKEIKLLEAQKLRERVILEIKRELNVQNISLMDEKVMTMVTKKEKEFRKKAKLEKKAVKKPTKETSTEIE